MNGFDMQDKKRQNFLLDKNRANHETCDFLSSVEDLRPAASAAMVNRTHRVIRERAKTIQERRNRIRSLWIPLSVCAPLFAAVLFAVWSVIDSYEIAADGVPESSQQLMIFMMWCLPLSLIVLTVVWLTRSGARADGGLR